MSLPPNFRVGGQKYEPPRFAKTQADLVASAVEEEKDILVVEPTLRTNYLDYYAIASLYVSINHSNHDRHSVLVVSPNTAPRERYEQAEGPIHFSTDRWPLATVDSEGEVHYRTEHYYAKQHDEDYFGGRTPGVIYASTSTARLPAELGDTVSAVLYDDAMKFTDEHWEAIQSWRREHDVPSTTYFVRDPLGDAGSKAANLVDAKWTWTSNALDEVFEEGAGRHSQLPPSEEDDRHVDDAIEDGGVVPADDDSRTKPAATPRERTFVRHKVSGIEYYPHVQTKGRVVKALGRCWEEAQELGEVVNDVDARDGYKISSDVRRTVDRYSRLVAGPRFSMDARASHGVAKTLGQYVSRLETATERVSGDTAAIVGSLRDAVDSLHEVKDAVSEADAGAWKRGAVQTAIERANDHGESILVVAADEPARTALHNDLRVERTRLMNEVQSDLQLRTPMELPQADPADHLVLYGPPKYSHRWLLRAPHSPKFHVLSYPHELGLLFSQASSLNRKLRELTPLNRESDSDDGWSVTFLECLDGSSVPSLRPSRQVDDRPNDLDGDSSPSVQQSPFDGVRLSIPNQEDVEGEELGEEADASFGGYAPADYESESVGSIVEEASKFDPDDGPLPPISSGSEEESQSRDRIGSNEPDTKSGLVDIRTHDLLAVAQEPQEKVEVVQAATGQNVEKPAAQVNEGDVIAIVRDRSKVRSAIEELLVESGGMKLVVNARLWRDRLQQEVERRDDSIEDFKERLEEAGLDMADGTYEDWYYGRVTLPKAKRSLRVLAEAYDMDDVLENFHGVREANLKLHEWKNAVIERLRERAYVRLSDDPDVDVEEFDDVLDEEYDIRYSDFDPTDEDGNPFVEVHRVAQVELGVTVPMSYAGNWRSLK